VSWFTTPSDLEARVSAAVTIAGLTSQLVLQAATALDPITGVLGDTSAFPVATSQTLAVSSSLPVNKKSPYPRSLIVADYPLC
jgi:hypothetical protein